MKNKFTANVVRQKFTWRSIFVLGRSQKCSKSHNNDRQLDKLYICSLFLLFNQNYFDLTHWITKFKRNIKQWRISNGHKAKNEAYLRKFRRNAFRSHFLFWLSSIKWWTFVCVSLSENRIRKERKSWCRSAKIADFSS